jgi:hypothetical protein
MSPWQYMTEMIFSIDQASDDVERRTSYYRPKGLSQIIIC